jgi:hypothetical protein
MDKKIGVSMLFSVFLFLGLFVLTNNVMGELDTNLANTKVELYAGSDGNLSLTKGGETESVNVTVTVVSTISESNVTNITINIEDLNYTFAHFLDAGDDAEYSVNYSEEAESTALTNVTFWAGGGVANWTCANISLYVVNCFNSTADNQLSTANAVGNTSLIIRFNVTATNGYENDARWEINTTDVWGAPNSTLFPTYIDGASPRITSINVSDGIVSRDNGTDNAKVSTNYELNGNNTWTVSLNVREMNPDSSGVWMIVNQTGENASQGQNGNVWTQMTQSVAPGLNSEGVYTATINPTTAVTSQTGVNFIFYVNDTLNQNKEINGSGADPFAFYPNTTLVNVVSLNLTTTKNSVTKTISNPVATTAYIANNNATVDVTIEGANKGEVKLYFAEGGAITNGLNEEIAGHNFTTLLYENTSSFNNRNISLTLGGGNEKATYTWSIDFSGNVSTNDVYVAIGVNSTTSFNNYSGSGLNNYTDVQIYNFRIDTTTPIPTLTEPSNKAVAVKSSSGISYTCNTDEGESGVLQYKWTLTKPGSDVETFTATSSAKTFSGDTLSKAGTYSIKCEVTDNVGNKAETTSATFSASHDATTGSGGGSSGGGSSGSTASFDVDLSTSGGSGMISAQQGRIKSFSFDGSTKHTITFDEVTPTTVTVTIASTPMTVRLSLGETKEVDINLDGVSDMSVTLNSVKNGVADIEVNRVEAGAQVVEREERAAAGDTQKVDPTPDNEPGRELAEPSSGSNAGLWVTILVILAAVVIGYFIYNKK